MWKGCSMKRVNCRENKQYREVRESKEGGEALRKRNCRFDSGSVSTESPREPWPSSPRPVLKGDDSYWNPFNGTSYLILPKCHRSHHRPPPTPKLTVFDSNHLYPFIGLFLILESMALPKKQKLSAWKFWKNDIFPGTKNSFHRSQLRSIYLASNRHCPTALVCVGFANAFRESHEIYGQQVVLRRANNWRCHLLLMVIPATV